MWRMFAIRDHDAVMDIPHGAFIAIDALKGTACQNQPGTRRATLQTLPADAPLADRGIPVPRWTNPARFARGASRDVQRTRGGPKGRDIDLGLRVLVRDGRSDEEIRAAIDKLAEWARRIEQVRAADAADGIALLERAAREHPDDIRRRGALFEHYLDEIERDKKRLLPGPSSPRSAPTS